MLPWGTPESISKKIRGVTINSDTLEVHSFVFWSDKWNLPINKDKYQLKISGVTKILVRVKNRSGRTIFGLPNMVQPNQFWHPKPVRPDQNWSGQARLILVDQMVRRTNFVHQIQRTCM